MTEPDWYALMQQHGSLPKLVQHVKRQVVLATIANWNGKKTMAHAELKIGRRTFYKWATREKREKRA